MYRYRINTNILHLTFSRAEFQSLQEYLMKKTNELTIYGILAMSKRYTTLPTRTRFFILSAGKIESVQEFKIKLFK